MEAGFFSLLFDEMRIESCNEVINIKGDSRGETGRERERVDDDDDLTNDVTNVEKNIFLFPDIIFGFWIFFSLF